MQLREYFSKESEKEREREVRLAWGQKCAQREGGRRHRHRMGKPQRAPAEAGRTLHRILRGQGAGVRFDSLKSLVTSFL